MAIKEPWNIYEGYIVDCNCEIQKMGLNNVTNWSAIPGHSIDYAYDGSGNVISATYKRDGIEQFKLIYTYDGSGNITNVTTSYP